MVLKMAEHVLLCLKCRAKGHVVDKCNSDVWQLENDWMFSDARMSMDFQSAWTSSEHVLCDRCQALDLTHLLDSRPQWRSQSQLTQAFDDGSEFIQSLGKTGSIQLWADCAFCYCLFAMTPNPSSSEQEVVLFPDWTMCRLSGEKGIVMDTEEKRRSATCLVSTLKPSSLTLPLPVSAHRGDALCLMDDDLEPQRTLGGRKISQYRMNVEVVGEWLASCSRLHGADCAPVFTEELHGIRLVDVVTGKVVKYPGDCEYVALSYVWGDTKQRSFKLGDSLDGLLKTLEDAICCTRKLRKRYLWADSLCIDQSDEKDKTDQISRMWSIYRGAYVTIIALSGSSADSGLSRLSRSKPKAYPQLTCCIKGRRLVGLMPTLSQQIWTCPWGKRAWTLQEAILSPRCLYLSDHQLYFECAAIQYSESLNQARSWSHNLSQSANRTDLDSGFVTWMMNQAGPGCLRNPLDSRPTRLDHWGAKVTLYSYRDMKDANDGLRAFNGILQRLETMYTKGFFWGLPIEDFDWGLLWRSQWPPTRREGFPSWCFAGWKGGVWCGQPLDITKPRRFPIDLEIYRSKAGQLEPIFKTRNGHSANDNDICIIIRNDPVNKASRCDPKEPVFHLDKYPLAEKSGYLFIDALCFHFSPDFRNPRRRIRISGEYENFTFVVRNTECYISIISTDREIAGKAEKEEKTFVLISRDHYRGFIKHHLLLIRLQKHSDIAERGTVLELYVPIDQLDVLEELKPQRRRIVLA